SVEDSTPQTMFPHFVEGRIWISGQANIIYQTNPPFYAKYSGPHSFESDYRKSTGRVLTLYTGFQLNNSSEVLFDVEETGGLGISSALGIAGFPNLDAVRDPTLSSVPYVSRFMSHHVIALSHDRIEASRGPLSTFTELPSHRLEIRIGEFAMTDF